MAIKKKRAAARAIALNPIRKNAIRKSATRKNPIKSLVAQKKSKRF